MLTYLLEKGKKILTVLIIGMLLSSQVIDATESNVVTLSFVDKQVQQEIPAWKIREYDVVVRVGEYNNKEGKRVYIDEGISWKDIPKDIPIHKDTRGHYVSEFDINYKVASKLVAELQSHGISTKLQVAQGKKQDLNAAGRISNESNPKLYISIHHNSFNEDSTGYFSMYNENDVAGYNIANRLSNSIKNNLIPQRETRCNDGYIGELNSIHNSTIPVLMELGFFSNKEELKIICGEEYTNLVSTNMANEISKILKDYWRD